MVPETGYRTVIEAKEENWYSIYQWTTVLAMDKYLAIFQWPLFGRWWKIFTSECFHGQVRSHSIYPHTPNYHWLEYIPRTLSLACLWPALCMFLLEKMLSDRKSGMFTLIVDIYGNHVCQEAIWNINSIVYCLNYIVFLLLLSWVCHDNKSYLIVMRYIICQ